MQARTPASTVQVPDLMTNSPLRRFGLRPDAMKRRHLLRAFVAAPWLTSFARTAFAADRPAAIIAAQFGTLPPAHAVQRVFAAGAPASVLIAVLAPEKLLGWPFRLSPQAAAWLSPTLAGLPHLGRLAGRGSTVSSETLLQLQPDLIVDVGTVDATYRSAMQRTAEQTGLPCVLLQGRFAEHPAQLRDAGRLLGAAERGEHLAARAEALVALAAQARALAAATRPPRVYFGRGSDGLETGLQSSINMEIVEACGGHNVAAEAGSGGITRVSPEQILAWDPEVILTQDRDFAARVRSDPLWRSVRAVRSGRVHLAPNLPFGWLDGPPGVNRLIGVRWLVERLFPALLAHEPPLTTVASAFYREFYGLDADEAAIAALLAEP